MRSYQLYGGIMVVLISASSVAQEQINQNLYHAEIKNLIKNKDKIVVTKTGLEKGDAAGHCPEYRFDKEKIQKLFNYSDVVTGIKLHHEYTWLPCFTDGYILDRNNNKILWTIRPIGISLFTFPDKHEIQLGCESKECCLAVENMCHTPDQAP